MNNSKIFSDLEANDINQLESALQTLFINIDTVAGRRAIFRNAGIDNYFIGNLDFNLGINEFITILVAKFKSYSVSRKNPNHPLIQLADYIINQSQQKYNLDDEDIEIFPKIYSMGLQKIKIFLTQSINEILESDSETYLINISQKLINEGCLSPQNNVTYENQQFELVGKITNFELSFGLFNMRGDAFFIFSYFQSINIKILRRYSNLCLQYATEKSTSSTFGQIINARVPSNICFSIAVVDSLNEDTKNTIRTKNPFDVDTDTVWYKVPVVYNLNEQKLYYYDHPSSFLENFKGEIVWKKLREVIENILKP
ncbi:MAG: hypothetical protein HC815_24930 [Richelia sp. RM1_1_1]|nr:hypothetical protein [Richelia sp. RM1_1_1]